MAAEIAPLKRSPEPSLSALATRSTSETAGGTPKTVTPSSVTTPLTVVSPAEADVHVIHIPSYSRWFTWHAIHECEARFVPEFFDNRSPSKNPRVYKYYRNAIIRRFRENPSRKITFTEVRKTIVGDVGSIRRVFDFLEAWGLINYSSPSKPQVKWDDKDGKAGGTHLQSGGSGVDASIATKRVCSTCKSPCTIACFVSEKHDMTLCARCYVRSNYRVGLSSSDFKRIEISETKSDWSDKETLQLLEALLHYGDDWKKVAHHVGGGRSAKECVARFIKLPFGEQFHGPPESMDLEMESGVQNGAIPSKRMCLSPLADTSNPIMAQAAFLSTLVGVDVAEVAARAAVTALSDLGDKIHRESDDTVKEPPNAFDELSHEARSRLEKEEQEQEKAISSLAIQVKEIEDKIHHFEELDLQIEKKRKNLQKLQNQMFIEQLTLNFHKASTPKTTNEAVKSDNVDVQLPT